ELVRVDPEGDDDFGSDGQRNQSFHITSAAADVGGAALHMRAGAAGKADHDGEQHAMPDEPSLVTAIASGNGGGLGFLRHVFPRYRLAGKNLYSRFDGLRNPVGLYPFDGEAGLTLAVLNADDVAHLQRMGDSGKLRALAAQVRGGGVLEEGFALGIHAPYANRDFG